MINYAMITLFNMVLYDLRAQGRSLVFTVSMKCVKKICISHANMPGGARKTAGAGICHVMIRGIYRQIIFRESEDDEKKMQFVLSLNDG